MQHHKNLNKLNPEQQREGKLQKIEELSLEGKGLMKHQVQEILNKRNEGQGYGTIARAMGMSRATIQTIVKRESNAVVGIQ